MSIQANYCVELLSLLYAELDQRSGWVLRTNIIQDRKRLGIAEGRTDNALNALGQLKMLDQRGEAERAELRLSNYGVDWFEKNFQLVERAKDGYRYEWSPWRRIRLVPPEQFYGRKGPAKARAVNWTKWGTILTGLAIIVSIALWKFS